MESKEFKEELKNVYGEIPREEAIDKTLENEELSRKQMMDELKKEKEILLSTLNQNHEKKR